LGIVSTFFDDRRSIAEYFLTNRSGALTEGKIAMGIASGAGRHFLFLQGPHGPFFWQLAKVLVASGSQSTKIGFNSGDRAFWKDKASFVPYLDDQANWSDFISGYLQENQITDLVLYGDVRPLHAAAIIAAKATGIKVHCFEEGYLRPYWVTYERGGVNGHSRLMDLSIEEMQAQLVDRDLELPDAPAKWGDIRHHMFYGAAYHFHLLFKNRQFKNWKTHREVSVLQEFRLHFRKFLAIPRHAVERALATKRIKRDGYIYHLALLQLSHDASIQYHSPFSSMPEFIKIVIEGFAKGAPNHHHLVIKAHPLEDNRLPIRRMTFQLAKRYGVEDRVHFVRGGKLASLLDFARSAVTVNSTAAQQALWRGLPVKAFGDCVYRKPEFVSEQPLPAFFEAPIKPDSKAYRDYRHYLLETSQILGGFYSANNRRRLIRTVIDMVLANQDPYDLLRAQNESPRQQLRVVK
jgi:capsular polysaccharide export protein